MSRIRADRLTNKEGTGAPLFPNGIRVVGLTSISNIAASTGTFTGNVSIGGTLTYEDVTNVDSLGVITARSGIVVTGVVTATSFVGDGSGLTGAGPTLTNGADNRVITATSATAIQGEQRLTYDGSNLTNETTTAADSAINIYKAAGDNADKAILRVGYDESLSFKVWRNRADANIYMESSQSNSNIVINSNNGGSTGERIRIGAAGQIGLSGANYGTSGQVLTSQGASAAPQWASVSSVQVSDGWWNSGDVGNNSWTHSSVWGSSFGSAPTRRSGFPSVSGQQMSIDGGGNWQFPSAGLWKVEWHLQLSSGANNTSDFYLIESTDGASSWSSGDAISGWNTHFCGNYTNDKSVATLHATVNFTNASTYYLQCKLSTNGNAIVRKGTMILFTKLN